MDLKLISMMYVRSLVLFALSIPGASRDSFIIGESRPIKQHHEKTRELFIPQGFGPSLDRGLGLRRDGPASPRDVGRPRAKLDLPATSKPDLFRRWPRKNPVGGLNEVPPELPDDDRRQPFAADRSAVVLMREAEVEDTQHRELAPTIAGTSWKVSLNVGREPGTAMPADWAASGARLAIPMTVRFTDEPANQTLLDRESGLDVAAGVRRLECSGGRFVGAQGEVAVRPTGGAWSAAPTGRYGQRVLRFFLDFGEEVARNDVTIPQAARVVFSTAVWDRDPDGERLAGQAELDAVERQLDEFSEELKAASASRGSGFLEGVKTIPEDLGYSRKARRLIEKMNSYRAALPDPELCVEAKNGAVIAKEGGLGIVKRERSFIGASRDFYYIIGKFSVAPPPEPATL